MTSHRYHRCEHCRAVYIYQSSGHPEGPLSDEGWDLNDGTHCPDCRETVIRALSAIPRRFQRVWEPTTEVTLEALLEAERVVEEKAKDHEAEGKLVVRRVAFPLFNLENGSTSKQAYVRLNRNLYLYQFWEGEEDQATITMEMEKNLQTGELKPWRAV